jgi:hypothetical protein
MYKEIAQQLFSTYGTFRLDAFSSRRFTQDQFYTILNNLKLPESLCKNRVVGTSLEGREIRLFSLGTGAIRILLWSQMHGDESTATMAIADIFNYINKTATTEQTKQLLSKVTIHFLPMLNPDGAERFQRRTAQGIDMNRDALVFSTPEARILQHQQQEIKPNFGFNLHDQELSTIGNSKTLTAIAVLTPAYNAAKEDNVVRLNAKYLTAAFTETMQLFVPGAIARYDDTFEPRAFGDNMQKLGTSTMLIESGHALNDPEKWSIRKLNAIGILSCLHAIATGSYVEVDIAHYSSLPTNGKRVYDMILRDVVIRHKNGKITPADMAISYQVDTHSEEPPILIDAGDLHSFIGLTEIDAKGITIDSSLLKFGKPFPLDLPL